MSAKQECILVVHNEVEIQAYLSTILESSGYTTFVTSDSHEGLLIALRERPDLIILEGTISRAMEEQLYGHLRTDPAVRGIPVVVLSSLPPETYTYFHKFLNLSLKSVLPEPEACLRKPPEKEELLDTVSRLIGKREVS